MNYAALFARILLPALALSAACDAAANRSEISGVQSFCVEPVAGPDGPQLEVSVQVDACLSSSCDSVVESECTITDVGGALQLEASAVIESKGNTCTADCRSVEVMCTAPVPQGDTVIVRGDDGDEVEIEAAASERACSLQPT